MKTIMAIDPAKVSGVAVFGSRVCKAVCTLIVKPRGAKGAYYAGNTVAESRLKAWQIIYDLFSPEAVIIERGFGGMATAVRAQGKQIGWHECMCAERGIPLIEVNVAEWRRVIKEDQGVSWPRDSKRCKALSVKLARDIYGMDVTPDEADALLMGRAALRMGLV